MRTASGIRGIRADTTGRASALSQNAWPVLVLGLFALAPFVAMFGAEGYVLSLLTRVMIFGIAAMSLDLILGYGAMVSFGHAAFLGIGAYTAGILSSYGFHDALVQVPVALAVAGLFAVVTGAISLRTRGVYFIMITLAFGQMLYFLATSLAAFGGDDGMTLPARTEIAGLPVLGSDTGLYYGVLAVLIALYGFFRSVVASRFGRVLRGTKDNAVRMQAIGFAPFPYQLTAYAISGMTAALAGLLLANQAEFISPATMSWQRSGELIFMVVLGGLGSLHGAIVGAAAFLLLEEFLPGLTEHWKMLFGPLLILVVLFARGGITKLFDRTRHV
jgi:branched-chain amino acid transport system permease protein